MPFYFSNLILQFAVHISNDKLGKMLVLVPPLPEQAKIVTQVEGLNLQISQLPE